MKPILVAITAVSLVLNLLLVGLLFAGRTSENPTAVAPSTTASLTTAASSKTPSATPVVNEQVWAELVAVDHKQTVQQLRDAGFPPHVVRAILAAQIRESFTARRKAIDPNAEGRPYWKNATVDAKVMAAQRQLGREEEKLLRDVLGADAESPNSMQSMYSNRRLDSVPAEKLSDVKSLLRSYDDQRNDLFSTFTGGMIGADMSKKMTAIEAEQQAALARILNPQELEEYNLRNSDTARQLQYQLVAFQPTEAEFRAIFKLQSEYDQRFGRMYTPYTAPEEMQRRMEADRQLKEQIKAVVGPARAVEYERANDHYYRSTSQLVARLELPPETTESIYAVQKDIQARSRDMYGPNTPPAERTAKMAALNTEAQTKIKALLGERGFEAYKQYGGSWMQMMNRQPMSSGAMPAIPAK